MAKRKEVTVLMEEAEPVARVGEEAHLETAAGQGPTLVIRHQSRPRQAPDPEREGQRQQHRDGHDRGQPGDRHPAGRHRGRRPCRASEDHHLEPRSRRQARH